MFNYLNGLITEVTPDYIVVDIQGVGYQVQVANPYAYQAGVKDPVKVYIYQSVREDSITLFGFQSSADKHLFLQLISVSGIECFSDSGNAGSSSLDRSHSARR